MNSTLKNIAMAVPQGNILGPLLFLVYINDFPFLFDLCNLTLFPDDTAAAILDNEIEDFLYECILMLDLLIRWSIRNRLTINFVKAEFMIFSNQIHLID